MAYIGNDVDAIFIPSSVNTSTDLRINGGALTQTGGDVNLDGGTFFLDESANRVGIGTITPGVTLDVVGTIRATNINALDLSVEDKNIVIGDVASPTNTPADGGGVTLKGAVDKTIAWLNATAAWTFSEHISIASAKEYRIAGTKVLDATSLGSAVVSSSLTSVGTIATGVWNGSVIGKVYLDATVVSTGDTGTVTSTMILDGTILDADINASAGIVDTKLATIATAGKVSNSATTATNANTASAIVARDENKNFVAGTITAALTGAASSNVLKAGDTMTGALVVPLGAFGTPSLTFTGDLNTGIFSPGADQLAVATNGTKRLQVDAGGNVSIDAVTDTGTKPLSIYSQARDCEIRLTTNSGTENNVYLTLRQSGGKLDIYSTNGDIALNPGNSLAATFKSDGKVGIGASSPNTRLEVASSISTVPAAEDFTTTVGYFNNTYNNGTNGTTAYTVLRLRRDGVPGTTYGNSVDFGLARYEAVNTSSRSRLDIRLGHGLTNTTDTTIMTLLSSGAVGIGTIAPRALLDIGGDAAFNAGTFQSPKLAVSNGYISIKSDAADGVSRLTLIGDSSTGDGTIDWGGNISSVLKFSNNGIERLRITSTGTVNIVGAGTAGSTQAVSFSGTAPVNSLVLDSSGRVGIGISAPSTPLNVHGTISTGRNLAREFGTVIDYSSQYSGGRGSASNVIGGLINFEDGGNDWLTAANQVAGAHVTIDLGAQRTVTRAVIYNQNEYSTGDREVKEFRIQGSSDNSSWTTIIDSELGMSRGEEPNPGWTFRIPGIIGDDNEGTTYRYWKFIIDSTHIPSIHAGLTEIELYDDNTNVQASGYSNAVVTSGVFTQDLTSESSSIGTLNIGSGYGNSSTTDGNLLVKGNVGIGTTDPQYKLQVIGSTELSELNLSGISSSISSTAVDVFVYDTRKDSDGGAWRKRTQSTSWYNETLNTATRGARKEFPAVAVIVSTLTTVTIYDGDDPDMPMWMVFLGSEGGMSSQRMVQYINQQGYYLHALNGILVIGQKTNNDNYGSPIIRFISEYVNRMDPNTGSEGGVWNGTIADRNNTSGYRVSSTETYAIVNSIINDVAMTVLPNAPIDAATGLPVPTIAVATNSGVSVIKDDGSVVNITCNNGSYTTSRKVTFLDDNALGLSLENSNAASEDSFYIFNIIPAVSTIITVDTKTGSPISANALYSVQYAPQVGAVGVDLHILGSNSLNRTITRANRLNFANTYGLSTIAENRSSPNNGMVAYATTSYSSGWMHGDIKGAWLSDTSTASVTGTELITNGTFSGSNLSSYFSVNNCSLAVVSNQLVMTSNTGNYYCEFYMGISDTTKPHYLSFQFVGASNLPQFGIYASPATGYVTDVNAGWSNSSYTTNRTVGTYTILIPAGNSQVGLVFPSPAVYTWTFDNISLKPVQELDRSVNNRGLAVYGTITKTAVATGANLVGYSGFSTTIYLQQPYNSALSFGTNDFSVMFWHYHTAGQPDINILRNTGGADGWGLYIGNTAQEVYISNGNFSSYGVFAGSSPGMSLTSTWQQWVFVRKYNFGWIVYRNGVQVGTMSALATSNFTETVPLEIRGSGATSDSIALLRISQSVPSPSQILKIYNDEKVLFQENSQATLYGASDAVTALAYDDTTDLLSVGTSSGRSDFSGLKRINNTTTAVTTAISASNGLIAEQ